MCAVCQSFGPGHTNEGEENATGKEGLGWGRMGGQVGMKGCRMCTFKKDVAGFGVGGDALEEGEGVADAVRCMGG